ncbi:MAG: SGNH/GDSL hydrolase family protein [Planctomycetota bacterium]|nr:SGNH/GDSL hydrolase family protein [Planctomycetota bacterium]
MREIAATTFLACTFTLIRADGIPPAWPFDPALFKPFWQTSVMHGESVLFVKEIPAANPSASLLFVPTKVLAVRDPSQAITYIEGRDYILKPGSREITLPEGSRITFKLPQDLIRPAKSQRYALTRRDGTGEILFGGGHEYHDMQATVTYEHATGTWTDTSPAVRGEELARTRGLLKRKAPVTITLLGDSISTGCNASGWAKAAPYQPPYQDLLAMNLKAVHGSAITLHNFSVGGTSTDWGVKNIDKVVATRPDLVILAFGMNDSSGRPAAQYRANILAMIEATRRTVPEAEFILVAPMLGNADWITLKQELFPQYRDALASLCGPGIALADMTKVWSGMLKHKKDRDLTGNGVNHPNDFGHRLYAQVLSALLRE